MCHAFFTTPAAPARLLLAALTVILAGCQVLPEAQPDPTRYYLLASPDAAPGAPTEPGGLTVGLRPVELPGYLRNTRSLTVARGPTELAYRDYDRWAEPLDVGLARVIGSSLRQSPRVSRVVTFPFSLERPRDFDLTIRVAHCEGVDAPGDGRTARFVASYEITRADAADEIVKQGVYVAPPRSWDGEAATLAGLLGEAAAEAARVIASDLP